MKHYAKYRRANFNGCDGFTSQALQFLNLPRVCLSSISLVVATLYVLGFFWVAPTQAAEPSTKPSTDDIERLILQLGADEFVLREDATKRLFDLGSQVDGDAVIQAVGEATQSSDREVRQRAERIHGLLIDRIRQRKAKQFISGEEVKVPGWKQFAATYGETEISRQVFAFVLEDEWPLFEACFDESDLDDLVDNTDSETKELDPIDVDRRRKVIGQRYAKMMQGKTDYASIPLSSLLGLYFVGSEFPESLSVKNQMFYMMINSPILSHQLRGEPEKGTKAHLIRRIVADWMMATVENDSSFETQALPMTVALRMTREARLIARMTLKNPQSLPVSKRAAMQAMAVLKDLESIPLIENFLTDKTQLQQNRPQLQMRDIALTCLMDLRGFDEGLEEIGVRKSRNQRSPYDYSTLGFETDEKRKEAFELYEDLLEEKKAADEKNASKGK